MGGEEVREEVRGGVVREEARVVESRCGQSEVGGGRDVGGRWVVEERQVLAQRGDG